MDTKFSVPIEVRISSEMFRLPSLGGLFNGFKKNTINQYTLIHFALLGVKEELLKNKVKPEEQNPAFFLRIRKMLNFVSSGIKDTDEPKLIELKTSAANSITTIDEILEIIQEKLYYKKLKVNLFNASTEAVSSHLSKYNKAL